MKKFVARGITAVTAGALAIFLIAMLFIVDNMNKTAAADNAINILAILEAEIAAENYTTPELYKRLAGYAGETDGVRITIIDLNGIVLADTLTDDVSGMENHLDREEIKRALNGETGKAIRKSGSFGSNYLYVAKLADAGGAQIILRAAVRIKTINSYIYGMLLTVAAVFAALLAAISVLSNLIARTANSPLNLIKDRLDNVLSPKEQRRLIALTKYDEINAALLEIDEISVKLNDNMANYRRERQKLDFIIENIAQGVIAVSGDKKINLFNGLAGKYFGIRKESKDYIGAYIRDGEFNDNLDKCIFLNEIKIFDLRGDCGRILEIRFIPVTTGDIAAIIVALDVTERRKLTKEKQEFFLNAGHELNTPLSSILGYSELMLTDGKCELGFVETINKEAGRMKTLISDMLLISGLESQKPVEDRLLNIKEAAERVIISYTPKARAKNIALLNETEDGMIYAEDEMIIELISNLVDNAIKYNYEGGTVHIKTEKTEEKIILTIKDDGIGIPQKYLNRVFERFFRADKGRSRKEGGTGLGLSIVKHIAGRYNAELSLESEEEVGTTVRVVFNEAKAEEIR
ncbi:MAG: GHKL domain-containing protein [Clostridiales bacterium]|jgi:two-component system phosphate regulon sensor histidine kinase PhoR|nr:GHKL domain-containing protein [Clostridiales bacterium]